MDTVDRIAEAAGVKERNCRTCVYHFGPFSRNPCAICDEPANPEWYPNRATLEAALAVLCPEGLPTLDDLARQQGVGPCMDPAALVVPGMFDEEGPVVAPYAERLYYEAIRHPDLWLSAVPIHPEVLYYEAMRTGVARCLQCYAPHNTCHFAEKSDKERRTCAEWTPAPAPEEGASEE
jgi:hypothetical protein